MFERNVFLVERCSNGSETTEFCVRFRYLSTNCCVRTPVHGWMNLCMCRSTKHDRSCTVSITHQQTTPLHPHIPRVRQRALPDTYDTSHTGGKPYITFCHLRWLSDLVVQELDHRSSYSDTRKLSRSELDRRQPTDQAINFFPTVVARVYVRFNLQNYALVVHAPHCFFERGLFPRCRTRGLLE